MRAQARQVLMSSASVELYTPEVVLEPIRAFAPIAFDPFANPRALVRAQRSIVLPEDGLRVAWADDGLNFSNPPYGRALMACARKTVAEARRGCEIITLVAARTGTAWWRALAAPVWCAWAGRIVFLEPDEQWRARVATARGLSDEEAQALVPRRRVGDLVANDAAPFEAALCYHGPLPEAFAVHFAAFGTIYWSGKPPFRRSGLGRPRIPPPPAESVRALLEQGHSVRSMARILKVPKGRVERRLDQVRAELATVQEAALSWTVANDHPGGAALPAGGGGSI